VQNRSAVALLIAVLSFWPFPAEAQKNKELAGKCLTCHKQVSPGLYQQWYESSHAVHQVTCIDCHGADKRDIDAFSHNGAQIAVLVTPKDCGVCHAKERDQVGGSHHARAGQILESEDAYLAHVTAGHPVAITGCEACHGANVRIDKNSPNKLSPLSWPNSGIGRINPDGSLGACNACHPRHLFSRAQARQPQSCSKCHLGPDHPQKEVYEESKHGNSYATAIETMNLHSDRWVVGQDYYAAPTCATCHMSATAEQPVTHDVGTRLSYSLRPAISKRQDNWQQKRQAMKQVCSACHRSGFIDGHYAQFDATVALYDEKFAKPATELMTLIRKRQLLEKPASFANDIEWTYWEIWHHEGRRARHGVSMMGPDYTWWHGLYEVAQHFYFKFLPQAMELQDPEVDAWIDRLLAEPEHRWMEEQTEVLRKQIRDGKVQAIYRDLFPQKP